jgi:hypothetical protein
MTVVALRNRGPIGGKREALAGEGADRLEHPEAGLRALVVAAHEVGAGTQSGVQMSVSPTQSNSRRFRALKLSGYDWIAPAGGRAVVGSNPVSPITIGHVPRVGVGAGRAE